MVGLRIRAEVVEKKTIRKTTEGCQAFTSYKQLTRQQLIYLARTKDKLITLLYERMLESRDVIDKIAMAKGINPAESEIWLYAPSDAGIENPLFNSDQ